MKSSFALCALTMLLGCGTADPLIGTWRSTDIGQFGDVATSMSQVITFEKEKRVNTKDTTTFRNDIGELARCVEVQTAEGIYALSGTSENQSLVFTFNSGTVTRTDCSNAGSNVNERPLSGEDIALLNSTGGKVVISGTTYALSNTINGKQATYTFQRQ